MVVSARGVPRAVCPWRPPCWCYDDIIDQFIHSLVHVPCCLGGSPLCTELLARVLRASKFMAVPYHLYHNLFVLRHMHVHSPARYHTDLWWSSTNDQQQAEGCIDRDVFDWLAGWLAVWLSECLCVVVWLSACVCWPLGCVESVIPLTDGWLCPSFN